MECSQRHEEPGQDLKTRGLRLGRGEAGRGGNGNRKRKPVKYLK